MKETLHQVWIGGVMPTPFKQWTTSAQRWAEAMGMDYKLWREPDLWQAFGQEPEVKTLRICLDTLPTPTSYSFASDFFRMRLVAEYGGLYLDADTNCREKAKLPTDAGIYCSVERFNPRLWSTWLLWAPGEGGKLAARALWELARNHFNAILPPGASDIPSRYINEVRRDIPGHGAASMGLGPSVFRRTLLPKMRADGWHVEALLPELASCRNEQAALKQCNAWSWKEPDADWNARAEFAKRKETMDALPPWQKAQSSRKTPAALPRSPQEVKFAESPMADGLLIPTGTRRIIIFSNVTRDIDPRSLPLQQGDHCIHINRARQYYKVADTSGVTHALVVRKGTDRSRHRIKWYDPPSTEGFLQVLHIADAPMRQRRAWWLEYCRRNPGQGPTSGFICWQLAREAAPTLPVVLAGFAPGENFGTPLWRGHAWKYEAELYARERAHIVRPDAAHMIGKLPEVRYLVMVCTGMQHKARRDAVRTTWAQKVPQSIAVHFYSGAQDAPPAEDADSPDIVRLFGISHAQGALPAAHIAMMRWALQHYDFRYLFKCDDDTYTALDRLVNYTPAKGAAMIGNPDPIRNAVALSGGAGYIIPREWVERLVFHHGPAPWKNDDVYISQEIQRMGGILMPERRFYHPHDRVPAPGNRQITAHWCSPEDMERIARGLQP